MSSKSAKTGLFGSRPRLLAGRSLSHRRAAKDPNNPVFASFRSAVVRYWRKEGRHKLPWRRTRDPYKILVSEVMLQQTQVDRVVPYYKNFLKQFPTVRALARAPLADVLKSWSGLGYNRRAKMLRECVKEIVEKHSGRVPQDFAALRALPGIGPYTASAIRAFAFDEPHEIGEAAISRGEPDVFVETNIRAALIHHFFPRAQKVPDAKLVPILNKLIHEVKSPREWYSALMDYGAHIKKTHPNPSRRSKHHMKQSRFEGSLRQARGVVLRASLRGKVRIPTLSKESGINTALLTQAFRDLKHESLLPKTTRSQ